MSEPSLNCTTIVPWPSTAVALTLSRWRTVWIWSSIGRMTSRSISSGLAPGYAAATVTIGGATLGMMFFPIWK